VFIPQQLQPQYGIPDDIDIDPAELEWEKNTGPVFIPKHFQQPQQNIQFTQEELYQMNKGIDQVKQEIYGNEDNDSDEEMFI
jgi:hypothetical protein